MHFSLKDRLSFIFLVKQICWHQILSLFVYLATLFIFAFHFILIFEERFSWIWIAVDILFLSALWVHHSTAFWLSWFLIWNQLLVLLRTLCMWWVLPFVAAWVSSCLWLSAIWIWSVYMCNSFSVAYLEIIKLFECVYWFFSSNLGSLCALFLHTFFPLMPLYLCSPSWATIMHMFVCLMVFHRSLRFCIFFSFFSLWSSEFIISIDLFKVIDSFFYQVKSAIENL